MKLFVYAIHNIITLMLLNFYLNSMETLHIMYRLTMEYDFWYHKRVECCKRKLIMEKTQVVKTGKMLADKGLVVRSWGNISVRSGDEGICITPSGISYELLEENDVVTGDIHGSSYEGGKASSEHALHEKIYQAHPYVRAIIHTHQPLASALGATDIDEIKGLDVAFVPYLPAGTEELAAAVAEAAEHSDIVMMRHHGCVCLGRGNDTESALADAIAKVEALEEAARKIITDVGLGEIIEKQSFLPPKLGLNDLDLILDRTFYWNKSPIIEEVIKKDEEKMFARTDDFAQIGGVFLYVDPDRGVGNSGQKIRDIEAAAAITNKNALAWLLSDIFGGDVIDDEEAKRLRQNYIDDYSKRDK